MKDINPDYVMIFIAVILAVSCGLTYGIVFIAGYIASPSHNA